MDAIALIRCSTFHQANEGTSLEAQANRIQAYCVAHGLNLIRTYTEAGVSGLATMSRRDALNECLDEVVRRKCALICLSLSRISRSLRDSLAILERIEKCGGTVISLTEKIDSGSASGKLVTNMMMLLHNFEVNQLRERVTSSMNFLRNNGKRISRFLPYGNDLADDGETLIENQIEREHINTMKAQRAAGRSYWQISGFLQQSNVPSKRNGRWTAASVRSILLRDAKIST